jgi:hypothetical protein
VQDAFRAGRLPLLLAERVAWLGTPAQAEIARRLAAGEDAKAVVSAHAAARQKSPGDRVGLCVRGLRSALRHVEGRVDDLSPHHVRISLPELERARRSLDELIARAGQDGGPVGREEEE